MGSDEFVKAMDEQMEESLKGIMDDPWILEWAKSTEFKEACKKWGKSWEDYARINKSR